MKVVVILLLLIATSRAQIIISEVLYNEPDNRTNLEWIEIYNMADTSVSLDKFILSIDSKSDTLPGFNFSGRTYIILASHLVSDSSGHGDSFEGHWGDSSGTWGDSYIEQSYNAINFPMNLLNQSGQIAILDIYGNRIDSYSWNSPGDDGVSVERDDVASYLSAWHQCYDPGGSTPGKQNSSVVKDEFSVSINSRMIRTDFEGERSLRISYIFPQGSRLTIDVYDDSGSRRCRLLDNSSISSNTVIWDARDKNGGRLMPGIYIIQCSLTGTTNVTKSFPVVIMP